jgi:hypothetical protein
MPLPQPLRAAPTACCFFRQRSEPLAERTGVYEEVGLGSVWRGIDVALRARGATVEKVFTIQPGARAAR